jgi:NADPH:quinone reductase
MRAVVFHEPSAKSDRTSVLEVPSPHPGPGQVSIDVTHAGINFVDVMARRGDPGYASGWPYTPGAEVSGIIREVGADVDRFQVGQRVAAMTNGGGLAEVAVADARLVAQMPLGARSAEAAAAPLPLSTAFLMLTDVARIRHGERILMHAAGGGVGAAVAQLAPLFDGGLRVGTVGRDEKVPDAERLGWDVVVSRDTAHLSADILDAAGGPVDIVLDASGTELLETDLAVVAPGGRIVLFGNAGGNAPEPLPGLGRIIGGNVAIAGFSITRLALTAPGHVAHALDVVLRLLASKRLRMPVTEIAGLDGVAAVHDLLASGRGVGKYVVAP